MEEQTINKATHVRSRTRSIAYVGLSVAIIAVCSWISIPIGPIPLTLQMFGIPLLIALLPPLQAIAAVFLFILIGALGVPVFAGFKGGLGALMGPTGGFLVGYLIGVVLAALFLHLVRRKQANIALSIVFAAIAGVIFTVCSYVGGCIQYSIVAGITMEQSFLVSCAPFIIPDLAKIIIAAICAHPIKSAIRFE